jgi:scyllo-inositol 2-dehydrogenase (NADP+)
MVRLGIVGTDHIASRMIACVAQLKDVRVTAIASSSQGHADPLAGPLHAAVCTDAEELSSRSDVDAVYVANANPHHAEAVRAAIASRKPVLVQKPIAMTPEESANVIGAARQAHVLLVENHWALAVPAAQILIGHADAQTLGEPLVFSLDFGYPVTPDLYPALFSPQLGVLRDRAGYGIAFAHRLLGPIADITAHVTWHDGVDTSATISLQHASGGMSKLGVSFDALLTNKATLACSRGLYRLEPSLGGESLTTQQAEAQIGPLTIPRRRPLRALSVSRALHKLRGTPKADKYRIGSDLHLPMLRHFIELVQAGKVESPLVPLDLSLETQRLVEIARQKVSVAA